MTTWNDVMSNPEFAKETPETQQAIRDDYFNKVIRPQVESNGDDVEAVYADFTSKYDFLKQTQPQKPEKSWLSHAGDVVATAAPMLSPEFPLMAGQAVKDTYNGARGLYNRLTNSEGGLVSDEDIVNTLNSTLGTNLQPSDIQPMTEGAKKASENIPRAAGIYLTQGRSLLGTLGGAGVEGFADSVISQTRETGKVNLVDASVDAGLSLTTAGAFKGVELGMRPGNPNAQAKIAQAEGKRTAEVIDLLGEASNIKSQLDNPTLKTSERKAIIDDAKALTDMANEISNPYSSLSKKPEKAKLYDEIVGKNKVVENLEDFNRVTKELTGSGLVDRMPDGYIKSILQFVLDQKDVFKAWEVDRAFGKNVKFDKTRKTAASLTNASRGALTSAGLSENRDMRTRGQR